MTPSDALWVSGSSDLSGDQRHARRGNTTSSAWPPVHFAEWHNGRDQDWVSSRRKLYRRIKDNYTAPVSYTDALTKAHSVMTRRGDSELPAAGSLRQIHRGLGPALSLSSNGTFGRVDNSTLDRRSWKILQPSEHSGCRCMCGAWKFSGCRVE